MHFLDIVVIAAYFIILLLIGVWTSRKIKNSGEYLICGGSLGKFLSTMLNLGSATSTDQAISVVSQSYRTGLSGIWFQWLYLFNTAFTWFTVPVCRRLRVQTAGEFYRLRYSRAYAALYAFAGMIILTLTIGIMLLAMGETIEAVTQGAISKDVAIILTAVAFISYGVLGGLHAAVVTDVVQGFLIIVLSFAVIPFGLAKIGGFAGLHRILEPSAFNLAAPKEMTLYVIIIFSIQAVIGAPGGPNVIPAFSTCKTEMDGRIGMLVGSLIKRSCTIGWVFMGLGTYAIFKDKVPVEEADKAFGLAIRTLLPPGLVGLMIAAMFAGVMSTCDAAMVFASGLFIKDILPLLSSDKKYAVKQEIKIVRIVSILVVIVGIMFAYIIPNIREGFIYLWQFCLFACFPFWCGIVWKRGTSLGAWASTIGTFCIWLIIELKMKNGLMGEGYVFMANQFLVCIPTGFLLYIIFSYLSKPEESTKLENFYRRLRTPVGSDTDIDKH